MKLPRTRQEYTQFALEYAGTGRGFYVQAVLGLQQQETDWGNERFRALKREIEEWIGYTVDTFPDLVHVEFETVLSGITVRIANVYIRTFNSIEENAVVKKLLKHAAVYNATA